MSEWVSEREREERRSVNLEFLERGDRGQEVRKRFWFFSSWLGVAVPSEGIRRYESSAGALVDILWPLFGILPPEPHWCYGVCAQSASILPILDAQFKLCAALLVPAMIAYFPWKFRAWLFHVYSRSHFPQSSQKPLQNGGGRRGRIDKDVVSRSDNLNWRQPARSTSNSYSNSNSSTQGLRHFRVQLH